MTALHCNSERHWKLFFKTNIIWEMSTLIAYLPVRFLSDRPITADNISQLIYQLGSNVHNQFSSSARNIPYTADVKYLFSQTHFIILLLQMSVWVSMCAMMYVHYLTRNVCFHIYCLGVHFPCAQWKSAMWKLEAFSKQNVFWESA